MQEKTFISNDYKISYRAWGPRTGAPIVCVHGLTGSSQDFKYIGEKLAKDGYRVLAIDMPGRGNSDFLKNSTDYNFDFYLQTLHEFLAYENIETCIWIGVSMGGLLGIRIAAETKSKIEKLILIDIGPEVPEHALDAISYYLTLSPVFDTMEGVVGAFKQSIGTAFYRGPMTEEEWEFYAASHVRKNENGKYIRSFDPAIEDNFKTQPLGKQDLWGCWHSIHQPVLSVHGELSMIFTGDIADSMMKSKRGAKMDYVTIKDAGHVPSFYPDDQIDLIRRWLSLPSL